MKDFVAWGYEDDESSTLDFSKLGYNVCRLNALCLSS